MLTIAAYSVAAMVLCACASVWLVWYLTHD